jgi:hypothetical protein
MTVIHTDQITLPGQEAAPAGPVNLVAMYVLHHGFRRDLAAFAAAVRGTPVGDRVTWVALAVRWGRFFEVLHKHHHGEDAALWPLLLARVDAAGDLAGRATLEAMQAEHGEIDPLLGSCAEGFARMAERADADARDALEVRVAAVGERLAKHLGHEERDAMALVQRYLTAADWERLEREHFKPLYKPRDLPFVVAWALHRLPADRFARVRDGMAGRPLELVWRLFLRGPFERREREAFKYV